MFTRFWIKPLVFLAIVLINGISNDSNSKEIKTLGLNTVDQPSLDWLNIQKIFLRANNQNCKEFDAYRFQSMYFAECPTGWFVAQENDMPIGPFSNLRSAVGMITEGPFTLEFD